MLKLAAEHYLKSIGDTYFVPSPDYLEWVNVNCFDIAIKRKPKWIWQDTKFFYDHMNINDLIDSPIPDLSKFLKKPEIITPNFLWSSKHNLNSKLGGKIASLISLDLSASDVIMVDIEMTGMVKQSINFNAFAEELKTKKIKLNNEYIRNIANNKYNVLCLVTQYLYLTRRAEMQVSVNWDISENSIESMPPNVSINDGGKVQCVKKKSIDFDAGTRLAFDFAEFHIKADGSLELLNRSDQSSKSSILFNISDKPEELPNYCAHISRDFDVPDIVPIKTGDLSRSSFKCCQLLENTDSFSLIKDLLAIAIDDQTVLKQLYSFMLVSQHVSTVDLAMFKENQNRNPILVKLLKSIGVDTDADITAIIQCKKLKHDVIDRMLLKIEAIYHLEFPYLQNLRSIIEERDSELMTLLFAYLHDMKKGNSVDNVKNRDKLFQDGKYKLLLLSVGVSETSTEVNEYFEPVFILFHAS